MRNRLRDLPDLPSTYPTPHAHHVYPDHLIRVAVTREVGRWMMRDHGDFSVMDLSCGDGAIARGIGSQHVYLGDYAFGEHLDVIGPLEETVPLHAASQTRGRVDLFINCETIEHLDDPDTVLKGIRECGQQLLLSTPIGNHNDDNPEHVWAWDKPDVDAMLTAAGFEPYAFTMVDVRSQQFPYCWGVWSCR